MFRTWDEPCGSSAVHDAHWTQRGFLWTDETFCEGIKRNEPTKSWRPSVNQQRIDMEVPETEPHKHFFKLTKSVKLPHTPLYTRYIGAFNVGWQCECGAYVIKDRVDLKTELMRNWWNRADQSWPS